LWAGFIATLIPALLAARAFGPAARDRPLRRIEHYLVAPPPLAFGPDPALASGAPTVACRPFVMHAQPNLIDAKSQLMHARYLAAGQLAGPVSQWAPFWRIQNTVLTPNGWVSHYPPGHVVLLALGFRLGAVWLVGPVMQGMTVLFTCLAAERLLHENRVKA